MGKWIIAITVWILLNMTVVWFYEQRIARYGAEIGQREQYLKGE